MFLVVDAFQCDSLVSVSMSLCLMYTISYYTSRVLLTQFASTMLRSQKKDTLKTHFLKDLLKEYLVAHFIFDLQISISTMAYLQVSLG